jgi:ribosomal protein S18 acetylase RimI-like enzyme
MFQLATLEDTSQLNKLVNSAYRGEASKKGWTTEEHLLGGIRTNEALLQDIILKKENRIFKYTLNNQIVGCVLLEAQKENLYLGMLTVAPDLQASGIGKLLMQESEKIASQEGFEKIVMTVISVRHELIAFYERRGYINTGEKKPFPMNDDNFGLPKQNLEFIVMEKTLA